jgi:hypothetical protein
MIGERLFAKDGRTQEGGSLGNVIDGGELETRSASADHELYRAYYQARGVDRNSLATNPEAVFQTAAGWICLVRAVQKAGINPRSAGSGRRRSRRRLFAGLA